MNTFYKAISLGLLGAIGAHSAMAQSPSNTMTAVAPDNSQTNKMVSSTGTPTADDQKNDRSDLMLAKKIRVSVMADKSLSTYAHNVKVVAINGSVTLNGVVRSQAEKDSIGAKAQAVVQNGSVTNSLRIAPAT